MRSVFGLLAAIVLLPFAAQAASVEGRASNVTPAAVDAKRVSKYTTIYRAELAAQSKDATQNGPSKLDASSAQAHKQTRPAAAQKSQKAAYFYFYDAHSTLISDRDADGYHSEFTIRFDADTTLGDELVYAKLYLRRLGDSDWVLYHVTDDFWINGESNNDDFYVRTSLDDGFATSEYDVLIDLYESGDNEIVATIDYNDAGELGLLPLEESGLDVPIEESGFSIGDVQANLLIDEDRDGYYSKFEIAFDPDADLQGAYLYARVWIRPEGGEWIEEHVSEDFPVDTSGQNDVYAFTADWVSGYPTASYDVQIDLYDASTNLLVASAGSERFEFSRLPLEDQTRDQHISPPVTGGGGSVTSHEHGGGAFEWVSLVILSTLFAIRARAMHRMIVARKINERFCCAAPRRNSKSPTRDV